MKADTPKILLVEDDPALALTLTTALEAEGYAVEGTHSAESAIERLDREPFPIVISDIYLERQTGLDVLDRARALNPHGAVIIMTGKGSLETVLEATRLGAFEYLSKPFSMERLVEVVRSAEQASRERDAETAAATEPSTAMAGRSVAMVEVYKFISRLAPTDATVLLRGETGTGKELAAQLIHSNSPRARGRFVVVDCAALTGTLLESELFGAVRGAYTGADRDRTGLLEAAAGGTVFLDEIGEMEPAFQLRFLRFLQEKEVRPVGSSTTRKVDVRVIAATNRDLNKLRAEGRFREDLWYRLSVAYLELPPLREHREDIPALAERLLAEFAQLYGRRARLEPEAVQALTEYSWPGNVRQLRHLLERLVILSSSPVLDAESVRSALPTDFPAPPAAAGTAPPERLSDAEEEHIRKVLAATGGNKPRAAAILGIERKTLYRKLARMQP